MNNNEIVRRVAELRAPVIAEMEITTTKTLRRLAAIAFGDLGDLMSWGPKFIKVVDSAKLTPEQAAMISEIRKLPDGTVVVKLHNPIPALRLLGEHLGLFSGEIAAATANLTVNQDNRAVVFVDRPPQETREEWIARRKTRASPASS